LERQIVDLDLRVALDDFLQLPLDENVGQYDVEGRRLRPPRAGERHGCRAGRSQL
jgi:hypothetical protein